MNRERQIYSNPVRQHFQSHLQPTFRPEQMNQDQTNTRTQHYTTQNLVHSTRQYCQAPTQNPMVSKQKGQNIQAPWQIMN